jgi:two-component system sensor histidine kinase UhpB
VQSWSSLPLSWRVCLINAAVFFVGAIVLVLSPATVSAVRGGAGRAAVGPVLIMMLNPALRTRVWRRWTS